MASERLRALAARGARQVLRRAASAKALRRFHAEAIGKRSGTSRHCFLLGVECPRPKARGPADLGLPFGPLLAPRVRVRRGHYGASNAIVYGVIPAAAPLIIVGTTALGIAASKADWPQFGAALAVVITGVVAAFVGPSGAWLAAGIGLFIALVGYGVADASRHRRVPLRT